MAVAVDEDLFADAGRLIVGSVLDEELAEEEGLVAELGGAGIVGEQVGKLVAEDGGAAWFKDNDGGAGGELGGECVEDFAKIFFCGVEHAEVVEWAAAAEVVVGEDDTEAGSGEDLVSGAQGGGMEVVVEGVGPKEDGGGFGWERIAAVDAAAGVAG
jgi:hypothetical protein